MTTKTHRKLTAKVQPLATPCSALRKPRIDFAAALGPTFTRNTLGLEGIYVPETPTETPTLTVEDQQWIDACFGDHIRSSAAAGFQAQSRSEFQANFSRLALIHRETVATPKRATDMSANDSNK